MTQIEIESTKTWPLHFSVRLCERSLKSLQLEAPLRMQPSSWKVCQAILTPISTLFNVLMLCRVCLAIEANLRELTTPSARAKSLEVLGVTYEELQQMREFFLSITRNG